MQELFQLEQFEFDENVGDIREFKYESTFAYSDGVLVGKTAVNLHFIGFCEGCGSF